jgi:nucleoside-diphosphate-sugar epimerase
MKVCVFGGAGFIGSRIVRCLLKSGHEVVTLIRNKQKGARLSQLGATVIIGDLSNRDDIRKAMNGADVVINTAIPSYKGRMGLGRARAIARQHFNNVRNILEEAKRYRNIPAIISEGTLVWGDSGNDWLDESSELKPSGMGRVGELAVPYVQNLITENKAPIIRISPCAVYGAGSWFENSLYALMKKGWFRTFGDGQNILSFVYVDDLAEAYRLATEKQPLGELFAIADDCPIKFRDFANYVAHTMGKPPVGSMPKWIGNIIAGKAMVETLTMNHKVRNTKAKTQLGWEPKYPTYKEGIPIALAEIEKS